MTDIGTPLVALVGDRREGEAAHPRIEESLTALGVAFQWFPTDTIDTADVLADAHGIWVVPGSPYRSMDGALTAIRYARESAVPYLGTCGGFQHALLGWARDVLGLAEADDVQSAPDAVLPLITPLSCSLRGDTRPLHIAADSRLAGIYGAQQSEELYHCCYGLNPEFAELFESGPFLITASDDEGAPRAVEYTDHPFFVGTLYQPELVSGPDRQHVLIGAFVDAVRAYHAERSGELEAAH